MVRDEGFDVIGDVHGHAGKLVELLRTVGYDDATGVWRHPTRRAVFVGDLIDRGPGQVECVRIARAMVEAGSALITMGNHEYNATAFHAHLREHSEKNVAQHRAFLEQTTSAQRDEIVAWFHTLPLWLELDGLRVVHACWDAEAIATLGDPALTPALLLASARPGTSEHHAIDHLLKGPEIPIDPPYVDKGGHHRDKARFAWWRAGADRLPCALVIPRGTTTIAGDPYPAPPDVEIDVPVPPYRDDVPVLYGHFWETGTPTVSSDRTACVDYSAGNGGPLVAYRWSGEAILVDDHFVGTDVGCR